MSRIYKSKINIDTTKVKEVYDKMFIGEDYKKHWSSQLLEERILKEGNLIFSLIEKYNINITNIYDIACGDGFPAILFQDKEVQNYTGYDFSNNAIKTCQNKFAHDNKYTFINKNISDLRREDFHNANLILSVGLFHYINDNDLEHLLRTVSLYTNTYCYFRQTTSTISDRLTLSDFYSQELETNYNAIYRTKQEYIEMFKKYSLDILETDIIKGIKEREETALRYYLLKTQ